MLNGSNTHTISFNFRQPERLFLRCYQMDLSVLNGCICCIMTSHSTANYALHADNNYKKVQFTLFYHSIRSFDRVSMYQVGLFIKNIYRGFQRPTFWLSTSQSKLACTEIKYFAEGDIRHNTVVTALKSLGIRLFDGMIVGANVVKGGIETNGVTKTLCIRGISANNVSDWCGHLSSFSVTRKQQNVTVNSASIEENGLKK